MAFTLRSLTLVSRCIPSLAVQEAREFFASPCFTWSHGMGQGKTKSLRWLVTTPFRALIRCALLAVFGAVDALEEYKRRLWAPRSGSFDLLLPLFSWPTQIFLLCGAGSSQSLTNFHKAEPRLPLWLLSTWLGALFALTIVGASDADNRRKPFTVIHCTFENTRHFLLVSRSLVQLCSTYREKLEARDSD